MKNIKKKPQYKRSILLFYSSKSDPNTFPVDSDIVLNATPKTGNLKTGFCDTRYFIQIVLNFCQSYCQKKNVFKINYNCFVVRFIYPPLVRPPDLYRFFYFVFNQIMYLIIFKYVWVDRKITFLPNNAEKISKMILFGRLPI